jgi:predicted amino acid-binding ACT domain protein
MKMYATMTLIGKDKSGVIARVTQFLFQQKANIESLEEQVTRGQFSMTLQASWPSGVVSEAEVRKGLTSLARQLEMELQIHFPRSIAASVWRFLLPGKPMPLSRLSRRSTGIN